MKIRTLLLIGSLVLSAACSESKYDLENLVPEEYHKILYVNNSGKQDLTLYDTNEDNIYTLSVIKAGSNPKQTASADIAVLSQQEIDIRYGQPEAVNYKLITEDCYSLETKHLDFTAKDHYKLVDISLKPENVKTLIESQPDAVWVLPLYISSQTDSVNSEKKELFLQINAVILPALGFTDPSVVLNEYSYGSVPTISKNIAISLDTDNKWDLEWQVEVDQSYIATYNTANGTLFQPLPEGTYTLPQSMTLPNGTSSINLAAVVNGGQLTPGDYMLPIRLTDISLFEISSQKAVFPFVIRILGTQLDRTGWTGEATTQEASGEGSGNGIPASALDGNLSTYWHSRWNGGTDQLPFEITIDAKKEYTFSQFGMMQRQAENYRDTKAGEFYVSSDKTNWTKVGRFTMQQNFEVQTFAITPTKGRYFKIKITESYRQPYCSLTEIYAYGME